MYTAVVTFASCRDWRLETVEVGWLIGKIVDRRSRQVRSANHWPPVRPSSADWTRLPRYRGYPPSRPLKDGFRPRVYYSNTVHLCRRSSPLGVFVDPWRRSGRVNAKRSA